MQWCAVVHIHRTDIRAELEQYLHSISTPLGRREMQRCRGSVILCVDIRTMLDQ
jgi:hypothetical protein